MDVFERLDKYPEVVMPLWGVGPRSGDENAQAKERFWQWLLEVNRVADASSEKRRAQAPNHTRFKWFEANAEVLEEAGERDPIREINKWLARYKERQTKVAEEVRPLNQPSSVRAQMEEVTPQFNLRPLPRVEKEEEEHLPFERPDLPPTLTETQEAMDMVRADALKRTEVTLITIWNMDVMTAHRRFHNKLFHETPWEEYLAPDTFETHTGPAHLRRVWEHWDELLGPMPFEERPAQSGYLMDENSPVPLED